MALGHECWGRGEQIVIVLNDWMSDTSSWNAARPYLDRERFTWVFTDLRGYGRSRALRGRYDLQEAAADVMQLIVNNDWPGVAVAGHSMSSLVALQLAQAHADRVSRAVVVTPPPPAGFGAPPAILAQSQRLALASDDERFEALAARFGDRLGTGWVRYKVQRWRETSEAAAVCAYAEMFTCQGLPDLSAPIRIPVLAITGEHDYPPMRAEGARANLGLLCRNLVVRAIDDSGHYPMEETPPKLVALIDAFLGAGSERTA